MGLPMGAVIRKTTTWQSIYYSNANSTPLTIVHVTCYTVISSRPTLERQWSLLPGPKLFLTTQAYSSSSLTSATTIVMYTATRNGPSTSAPGDGSRTLTITNNPTREESGDEQGNEPEGGQIIGTLRLRTTRLTGPRVAWDEDVIDNEGFGKKKSKSKFHFSSNYSIEILIQFVFHLRSFLFYSLLHLP